MINFGQMPRGAMAALQMPFFALVGALATTPPVDPPVPPPTLPLYGGTGPYWHPEQVNRDHPEELLEVLEILLMHDII